MAENTAPQPAMTEAQVIQQYAVAAGLDANKLEHAGIITQTLQVAAAQGMSAENSTQVKAMIATMQELARLEDKPEELKQLATALGIDVAAVEQQRQAAIASLEQMEANIKQNQKRQEELQSKAGSKNIINMVVALLGGAASWYGIKSAFTKWGKKGEDGKLAVPTWQQVLAYGSGIVAGIGIAGKIAAMFTTKPLEKEFQSLDAQNQATDTKMQETVSNVQGQSAGIAEELTKRLLAVAFQQLEEQEKQIAAAPEIMTPPAQTASDQTPPPEAATQHQAGHGTHPDVIAERKETHNEIPLYTATPQHQNAVGGADNMTVKKETGAPQAQGFAQKVPAPAPNHLAAAETSKAMQPVVLGA